MLYFELVNPAYEDDQRSRTYIEMTTNENIFRNHFRYGMRRRIKPSGPTAVTFVPPVAGSSVFRKCSAMLCTESINGLFGYEGMEVINLEEGKRIYRKGRLLVPHEDYMHDHPIAKP